MDAPPATQGTSGSSLNPNQLYVGTVVDNKDPKFLSRLRIRVAEAFAGIPDEHLPWAIASVSHSGGAGPDHGNVDIPVIGSKVLVLFQNGSPMHPMYKGYFVDETTVLEEAKTNYPDRRVTLMPKGSMVIFDDKSGQIFIRNMGEFNVLIVGNTHVKIEGDLVQEVTGNRFTKIGGDDYTVVDGTIGSYASGDMKLKSGGLQALSAGANQVLNAGGNSTRDAGGVMNDNAGVGDQAGSAPAMPQSPEWTGIRGQTP